MSITEAGGALSNASASAYGSWENGGCVIDPAEADALVEPFRRLSADRTGSVSGVGLGLAIVAAIASAHDGALLIKARPTGGLTMTVELPRARPESGATV